MPRVRANEVVVRTERSVARAALPMFGALAGLAWYVKAIGGHTIDPTALGWVSGGDTAAHLLGWLFFRNEPWTLPLGEIGGLLYPAGTTLGFTDANPWVSLILKPFSTWLPADFQFIGLWLALCFALQGVFGARVMECLTPHALHRVLGTLLFVLAPPLLFRVGHDTLCAHWLLLALIWLHLRPAPPTAGTLAWAFVLNSLAAGTHPYLAAMLFPLTLALLVRFRLDARIGTVQAIALGGALLLQTTAVFGLFGYLGSPVEQAGGGFGIYSTDLLAFVNAMGHSRWLPALPAGPGQYEGFAFLGSGVIALAIVAIGLQIRARQWPRLPHGARPLLVAAALTGLFALSNIVTMGGHVVLTARSAYDPIAPIVDPFRASGRFIWPLFYVVLTGILALVVRRGASHPRAVAALLAAAIGLQAAEVSGVWPGPRVARIDWQPLQSPVWDTLGPSYRHLALYPPFVEPLPPTPGCQLSPLPYTDVVRLAHRAYRSGLTVNSAYVARAPYDAIDVYCRQLHAAVRAGRLAPATVYVVHPDRASAFAGADATCGTIDGFQVCVPNGPDADPFRDALMRSNDAAPAVEDDVLAGSG